METLIKNVNIITPYEVLRGHGLVIKDGIISSVEMEEKLSKKYFDNVIDGKNNFLSPGFIDIHNHGNSGYDVMDCTEEAIDNMAEFHVKNGVTSFLGTVITSSNTQIEKAIRNLVSYKSKEDKANLIGIHLEGPFFSLEKKGAQPEKHIIIPNLEYMEKLIGISNGKIKMVSIAPELKGALPIISYLKSNNVVVAMAHSNATYEEAKKGIYEGISVATHLFNGMRSFSHREPGIVGAALTDERVYCELIYDTIHLHDISVEIAMKMKGIEKIVLVSDAMRATGIKDGEYELGGQRVFVRKGVAKLENGTLAGSTLNLRKAVHNMVSRMNLPIHKAVSMASINPAKAININDRKGSLEVGKDADVIIFDRNINILASILGGNLIWTKS